MAIYQKKEEIYGFQTLYREIGYYINRLEQYERALKFFNQAVLKTPTDRRALLGRGLARSKACQYEGALEDIRTALQLEPDSLILLAHQALNTYLSCEFEDGLVRNMKTLPRRKKPDHFVMGVMHCTDAIENCVGERTGRPLRDHFKIIRRLAWKKYYDSQKPYEPKSKFKKKKKKQMNATETVVPIIKKLKKNITTDPSKTDQNIEDKNLLTEDDESIRESLYTHESEKNIIPPCPPYPYRPLQNYTSNIKTYMAEKYLDSMYLDKIFLENLIYEPGVRSPNKKGKQKILQAAKAGYKAISHKQELLRTRRPFYYLKYQMATSSGALKARQEAAEIKLRETALKEASALKGKMDQALQDKRLQRVLRLAEKLKSYCDSKPKKILPEREFYLQYIYETVCQAHFDMKRLNKNLSLRDQEKRIYSMFGIQLSREPSSDSVIAEFKGVFLDWKKMIHIYEQRLRKSTESKEIAWLYHELARFYMETKQYEISRVYARKCISEGINIGNLRWVINATMLMTKINIAQQNRNDAKLEVLKAVEVAKEMNNKVTEDYLRKCLEVVDKIEFDDLHGPKIVERREKKIIDMMQTGTLKAEAAHLFSMMQAMPMTRRMFVMPGVKVDKNQDLSKKDLMKQRQSIMPSARAGDLEIPDISNITTTTKKRQNKRKQETSHDNNTLTEFSAVNIE